jgi:hypothetical protein
MISSHVVGACMHVTDVTHAPYQQNHKGVKPAIRLHLVINNCLQYPRQGRILNRIW